MRISMKWSDPNVTGIPLHYPQCYALLYDRNDNETCSQCDYRKLCEGLFLEATKDRTLRRMKTKLIPKVARVLTSDNEDELDFFRTFELNALMREHDLCVYQNSRGVWVFYYRYLCKILLVDRLRFFTCWPFIRQLEIVDAEELDETISFIIQEVERKYQETFSAPGGTDGSEVVETEL